MLKLEARPEASKTMSVMSPVIALAITVVIGTIHGPVARSASRATPPAASAPITNCPSAPMFQTFER